MDISLAGCPKMRDAIGLKEHVILKGCLVLALPYTMFALLLVFGLWWVPLTSLLRSLTETLVSRHEWVSVLLCVMELLVWCILASCQLVKALFLRGLLMRGDIRYCVWLANQIKTWLLYALRDETPSWLACLIQRHGLLLEGLLSLCLNACLSERRLGFLRTRHRRSLNSHFSWWNLMKVLLVNTEVIDSDLIDDQRILKRTFWSFLYLLEHLLVLMLRHSKGNLFNDWILGHSSRLKDRLLRSFDCAQLYFMSRFRQNRISTNNELLALNLLLDN